jgi:hypothetical protein
VLLILAQLAALFISSAGWGAWVSRLLKIELNERWSASIYCGLAGFCAQILFLENLVYLELPVRYTAWAAGLIGLAGWGVIYTRWKQGGLTLRPEWKKALLVALLVFTCVFLLQGIGLISNGPHEYYGNVSYDHVNYVLLGQFLLDNSFSMNFDPGLHPWLYKAQGAKLQRIGQSVANAYLAALTGTDVQASYGTLSIFVIAILAVSCFVLLREFGTPLLIAAAGGLWVGCSPGITHLQLQAFLSQSSVLFIFPITAAYFRGYSSEATRRNGILAIYGSYVLCCYSELYVLILGLIVILMIERFGLTSGRWIAPAATVTVGSLVIASLALPKVAAFVGVQYNVASQRVPLLEALAPNAGTLTGWGEMFFGPAIVSNPQFHRLYTLGAIALLICAAAAFSSVSRRQRIRYAAICAIPFGAMAILISAPEFAKYPFAKIQTTFLSFWIFLIVIGTMKLAIAYGSSIRLPLQHFTLGVLALAIAAAAPAVVGEQLQVARKAGPGGFIHRPQMQEAMRLLNSSSGQKFVINDPDPLAVAWLAYYGRKSDVYIDSTGITDLPLPKGGVPCTRLPEDTSGYNFVSTTGVRNQVSGGSGEPDIRVHNPQGEDRGGDAVWYWMGDSLTIDVARWTGSKIAEPYTISFRAEAGPANPSPGRKLRATFPDGRSEILQFQGAADLSFTGTFPGGKTTVRLDKLEPEKQTSFVPNDPRNLMTRIGNVRISSVKRASATP